MPRQAIEQATCTECGENESNYHSTDDTTIMGENILKYDVVCSCGEDAIIVLDTEGTHASENVSYENASWNQDEEGEPTGEDSDGMVDVATGEEEKVPAGEK
jgi:hypothetical protein